MEDKRRKGDEQYQYFYYKDNEGRIQRIRKLKYVARPGYIRLKFLQKLYVKYIRSSYDSKLTYLPWIVGLATAYFIYQTTMLWSQNELNREIKARLPFEFKNEQVKEVYRLLKEHNEEQKKLQGEGKEEGRGREVV